MYNIEKVIDCFKTHLDPKDMVSPYEWKEDGRGHTFGFNFLEPIRSDERLLVCSVSVNNKDCEIGLIEVGKVVGRHRKTDTMPIYTISGGSKGDVQCGDEIFWVMGGNWNKNKFNEYIYIRPHNITDGITVDVAINGILIKPTPSLED